MYFYTQVCLHRYMKICKNVLKVVLNKTYIEYVTLLITVIFWFFFLEVLVSIPCIAHTSNIFFKKTIQGNS